MFDNFGENSHQVIKIFWIPDNFGTEKDMSISTANFSAVGTVKGNARVALQKFPESKVFFEGQKFWQNVKIWMSIKESWSLNSLLHLLFSTSLSWRLRSSMDLKSYQSQRNISYRNFQTDFDGWCHYLLFPSSSSMRGGPAPNLATFLSFCSTNRWSSTFPWLGLAKYGWIWLSMAKYGYGY